MTKNIVLARVSIRLEEVFYFYEAHREDNLNLTITQVSKRVKDPAAEAQIEKELAARRELDKIQVKKWEKKLEIAKGDYAKAKEFGIFSSRYSHLQSENMYGELHDHIKTPGAHEGSKKHYYSFHGNMEDPVGAGWGDVGHSHKAFTGDVLYPPNYHDARPLKG